jgi:hypothetical protein
MRTPPVDGCRGRGRLWGQFLSGTTDALRDFVGVVAGRPGPGVACRSRCAGLVLARTDASYRRGGGPLAPWTGAVPRRSERDQRKPGKAGCGRRLAASGGGGRRTGAGSRRLPAVAQVTAGTGSGRGRATARVPRRGRELRGWGSRSGRATTAGSVGAPHRGTRPATVRPPVTCGTDLCGFPGSRPLRRGTAPVQGARGPPPRP